MSLLIRCRGIGKSFGERQVLRGIDWEICSGERIGLVGRNGSGKSTLSGILAGIIEPDPGEISYYPPNLSLNLLNQDGRALTDDSFLDTSGSVLTVNPIGRLAGELRLKHVIAETPSPRQNLSGGERIRLSLAQIWANEPQLLILDEPTNNLDIEGMEWLAGEIARLPAAVIIISHDRRFLDQTVTWIVELQEGHLTIYRGNYSFYREEKQRLYQSRMHAYEAQARESRRLEMMITQLKGWSEKAHRESRKKGLKSGNRMGGKEYYRAKAKKRDKAIKSQIRHLEKMRSEGPQRPAGETAVRFRSAASSPGGKRLLEVQNLARSFDDRVIFSKSDFWINRGEKAALIGPNGCGKSTLLKMIMGLEPLTEGDIFLSPGATVAYVAQDAPLEELPSLRNRLAKADRHTLGKICTLMANLGLDYSALARSSTCLSHGEKMKMEIALALYENPDLIVLDEPGNHLDLFSLESLEKSLQNYPGTLLLVSHDRFLVQAVCDCLLVFEDGCIIRREGRVEDYQARLSEASSAAMKNANTTNLKEQAMLLDTQIACVLGQLSTIKPNDSRYAGLEIRYQDLCQQKAGLQ